MNLELRNEKIGHLKKCFIMGSSDVSATTVVITYLERNYGQSSVISWKSRCLFVHLGKSIIIIYLVNYLAINKD